MDEQMCTYEQPEILNAGQVETLLIGGLEAVLESGETRTFEDAGLLTQDKGLVLQFRNGAAFQISIVRSDRAHDAVSCSECGEDFLVAGDLTAHLVEAHGDDVEDATFAAADAW